jgi:hypothetical protein
VRLVYDPRELSEVMTISSGVAGVLHSMLPPSLQETTKSRRVQITYEGPLISYIIYDGRNPAIIN